MVIMLKCKKEIVDLTNQKVLHTVGATYEFRFSDDIIASEEGTDGYVLTDVEDEHYIDLPGSLMDRSFENFSSEHFDIVGVIPEYAEDRK